MQRFNFITKVVVVVVLFMEDKDNGLCKYPRNDAPASCGKNITIGIVLPRLAGRMILL
jgi:hypothetical protein